MGGNRGFELTGVLAQPAERLIAFRQREDHVRIVAPLFQQAAAGSEIGFSVLEVTELIFDVADG